MILVSACLLGLDTKYDGNSNAHSLILQYSSRGQYVPICPEQLGGLASPRPPAEIIQGSGDGVLDGTAVVLDDCGGDVTRQFKAGANQVIKIAALFPVTAAILKERSPSCGVNEIYDGTFSHKKKMGQGVTAALLRHAGIQVVSEEGLTEERLLQLLDADREV